MNSSYNSRLRLFGNSDTQSTNTQHAESTSGQINIPRNVYRDGDAGDDGAGIKWRNVWGRKKGRQLFVRVDCNLEEREHALLVQCFIICHQTCYIIRLTTDHVIPAMD